MEIRVLDRVFIVQAVAEELGDLARENKGTALPLDIELLGPVTCEEPRSVHEHEKTGFVAYSAAATPARPDPGPPTAAPACSPSTCCPAVHRTRSSSKCRMAG